MQSSQKRIGFAIFACVLLAPGAHAANPAHVNVPEGPTIELELPDKWQMTTQPVGPAVTLQLTEPGGPDFLVMMTIMPPSRNGELTTAESMRKFTIDQGNRSLPSATQTTLELSEVRGKGGTAYLYHLTDRNPEKGPGDYREAHQGGMLLGENLVTITILTHPGAEELVELAKAAIASMKISPPPMSSH